MLICKLQLMHVARAGGISESLLLAGSKVQMTSRFPQQFDLPTVTHSRRRTMATLGDQAVGGVLMLVGLFIWLYYTAWTIVTVS
jgi:hypothetical protein